MLMHWPEVSKEQYEAARREVAWETDVPKGAKFHVSWFGQDGFRVLDLWESAADFQTFVEQRLMPGIAKIGIEGQPKVELVEANSVFAPNV
ncbi:MAG TPA: hypothetical protein VHL59_15155 [Thermoanaerobaculia bacterium]|nr:hypothetical protein [Thermoanaerobaculia bacterium]